MFKYAIVIVVVAVSLSVSLAATNGPSSGVSAFNNQEPRAAASSIIAHKKHQPEKIVYVTEQKQFGGKHGGVLEAKLLGLLGAINLPKKLLGVLISYVVAALKKVNLKKLLDVALLAGLATVLGAVASAAASGLFSLLPGLGFMFGGFGQQEFQQGGFNQNEAAYIADSQIDAIGEFAIDAINRYEQQYKA